MEKIKISRRTLRLRIYNFLNDQDLKNIKVSSSAKINCSKRRNNEDFTLGNLF